MFVRQIITVTMRTAVTWNGRNGSKAMDISYFDSVERADDGGVMFCGRYVK
jgi:hypothetical protein